MLYTKHINSVNRSLCSTFFFLLLFILLCGTATGSKVLEDIQITRGVNEDSPAWSSDGKKLVYASDQDIWIANVDGSSSRKVYGSMSWDGEPVFFDSQSIIFASEQVDAFSSRFISIHRIGIDGIGRRQLTTNAHSREPSLSPDGSRIAYISRIGNDYDIWLMEADGTSKIRLTDGKGNERDPSWSPDGKYIVYSFQGNIFKIDVLTGSTLELTNDTFQNTDPEVSPDGSWITFVSNRSGNQDIWLMDAQGKGTLQLTSDKGIQKDPSWNPKGNQIAYVSDASGEFNIWVMTLEDELYISEHIEQEETAVEDEKELFLIDQVLTKGPLVIIGAATMVLLAFVIFMIRSFLKNVGFL